MNRHTREALTTAALRDLDPAPDPELTPAERERAEAMLARVLAASPEEPAPMAPARTGRPRRRLGRLLVPAGLAVATVPVVVLGGGSAFGSWTPTPEPLTGTAAAAASATCRQVLAAPDGGERLLIAERRGDWTYVLLGGPGTEAACLMPDDLVGQPDPSARQAQGFFGMHDPDPPAPSAPPRDGIVESWSMGGAVLATGLRRYWPFHHDDWFGWVSGYVGSDVTGVTVHPPVGPAVEASVENGRYSAWWPAGEARGDNPGVSGAWSYTVTLRDGSTQAVPANPGE